MWYCDTSLLPSPALFRISSPRGSKELILVLCVQYSLAVFKSTPVATTWIHEDITNPYNLGEQMTGFPSYIWYYNHCLQWVEAVIGFGQIPFQCRKAWNTSDEAFHWQKHLHFWNLTSRCCSQVAVSQYFRWLLRFRSKNDFHSCTHRDTPIRNAGRILQWQLQKWVFFNYQLEGPLARSAPKLRTLPSSTKHCTDAFFLGDRLSPFFLSPDAFQ